MANSAQAKKRIRQNATRRLRNRFQSSTTRTAVKKIRATTDKEAAQKMLPEVVSLIDKCVKNGIMPKNRGANLKSKIYSHVNKL